MDQENEDARDHCPLIVFLRQPAVLRPRRHGQVRLLHTFSALMPSALRISELPYIICNLREVSLFIFFVGRW